LLLKRAGRHRKIRIGAVYAADYQVADLPFLTASFAARNDHSSINVRITAVSITAPNKTPNVELLGFAGRESRISV
jgi:hypothetical protein